MERSQACMSPGAGTTDPQPRNPVCSEQGPGRLLPLKNWCMCGGRVLGSEDPVWRLQEGVSIKPRSPSPTSDRAAISNLFGVGVGGAQWAISPGGRSSGPEQGTRLRGLLFVSKAQPPQAPLDEKPWLCGHVCHQDGRSTGNCRASWAVLPPPSGPHPQQARSSGSEGTGRSGRRW